MMRVPTTMAPAQMYPTRNETSACEAPATTEHLVAELRAHEKARLDLVLRHESELAEAEAHHQAANAALQARCAATEQAYQRSLQEVLALTQMVLEVQTKNDTLAAQCDAAEAASTAHLDELRSTVASRDAALADVRSSLAAAEEELAALRQALVAGDEPATDVQDAPRGDATLLRGSALFDAAWYRRRYADVDGSGMDPVDHYLLHGAAELRDPGPAFSTAAYLGANPDVAASGANPLVHYLREGLREGRIGRPSVPPANERP